MSVIRQATPDEQRAHAHGAAALADATSELRRVRQMLESLSSDARTVEQLRDELTALAGRLAARTAWLEQQHLDAIERWQEVQAVAGRAERVAREAFALVGHAFRIDETSAKIDRIDELIALLDQLEVLALHR